MEELKVLIEMVADLPHAALWVIAALFAYKVCVVGSIYGVIRLAIVKTHSWLTMPKHERHTVELLGTIRGIVITDQQEAFIAQLMRLRGKGVRFGSNYVHCTSVEWLREAIDAKERAEAASEATP